MTRHPVAMFKPSAEYNRRAAIIERNIRFFGCPRSTVYYVIAKYNELEMCNKGSAILARKVGIVQQGQELISPTPTSHLVQNLLSDNVDMFLSKEFWPPNSPDLNPLDFYVWSWDDLQQIQTPKYRIIESCVHRYGPRRIEMGLRTLQVENGDRHKSKRRLYWKNMFYITV